MSDFRERAAIAFRRALALDSDFAAPLAGLIEAAAFARDTAEVRRLAARHIARMHATEGTDYIRWRVAVALEDSVALSSLRARFDSIDTSSIALIQFTSQVDGVALEDAERAVALMLRRAGDAGERTRAMLAAQFLALNRGRPREAIRINDTYRIPVPEGNIQARFRVGYALFWDGDASKAQLAAHVLERSIETARKSDQMKNSKSANVLSDRYAIALWRLSRGDTSTAAATVRLLRIDPSDSARVRGARQASLRRADVLDAVLAAATRRPDASALLDRLDSLTQIGCCETPHPANLVVARLREREGNMASALNAVRRQKWYFPPEYLSIALRGEGRLAALTQDTIGAIKAYRHYLALRSNPEPEWLADADKIRNEVRRLERLPR